MENRRLIRVVGEEQPEENKYMGTRDEKEYFRVRVLDEDHQYYADEEDMDCTAGNGYLEILKWLQENHSEGCTDIAYE